MNRYVPLGFAVLLGLALTLAPAAQADSRDDSKPKAEQDKKEAKKSSQAEQDKNRSNTGTTQPGTSLSYDSGAVVLDHPGRLLASNCFQCHGTNGRGMEHLAGQPAREILGELDEMRAKAASRHIMNVHAQGYTPEQLSLIADYFSRLPR